jgi:competence protein ComEA
MNLDLTVAQVRVIAIALGALVGVVGLWWWLQQPQSQPIIVSPTSASSTSPAPQVGALVIVDVVGGVKAPGVVQLPLGSRVIDAVEAAGGLKSGVTAGINMARVLVDGEQIVIGVQPSAPAQSDGKVHLNSATQSELEELPGVGPVLASRLIEYRTEHGNFHTMADLDAVSGVGPAMLDNLADVVSFD